VKLTSQQQLENTQKKLRDLEGLYAKRQNEPATNEAAREQTLRSLKRAINRLKEEIARYQVAKSSA
jgi:hypothetical protein